jgi:ribosome-binding protein aMBF1 (putative translation factor)
MAANRKKTGFDKFFDEQMRDDKFRTGYEKIKSEIDAVDALVRALDEARVALGLSKAELARQISAEPAAVRRLFTAKRANPTLATFATVAEALGYEVRLVRKASTRRGKRSGSAADGDEAAAS